MRIFGVNIPDSKRIEAALPYLYGIGPSLSTKILAEVKIDPNKRAKDMTADEILKIQNFIEKSYPVEGDLRQRVRSDIGRLKDLQTYRGMRHARKLPVHGHFLSNCTFCKVTTKICLIKLVTRN